MTWLNKLERKFGRYAIRDLMTYIVVLNAVVFGLTLFVPESNLMGKFILDPALVLRGEVWRLLTFIVIPPPTSLLWIVFALYFYYLVGSTLEQKWGSFRFNFYYLIGLIATIAAAFIGRWPVTAVHLNLSLFLAFAYLFPDFEIRLFLLLPIKVKYLAWVNWLFLAFSVLFYPLPLKLTAAASVVNYFVFFGVDAITGFKTRRQVHQNRKRFRSAMRDQKKD